MNWQASKYWTEKRAENPHKTAHSDLQARGATIKPATRKTGLAGIIAGESLSLFLMPEKHLNSA
jgi:hypothetical protein